MLRFFVCKLTVLALLMMIGLRIRASGLQTVLELRDMTGAAHPLHVGNGRIIVLVFMANRCPMSNAFNERLNILYNEFHHQLDFIVLNANDNESLADISGHANSVGYDFPIYKDAKHAAADFVGARKTPESFVLDRAGTLIYRGYIEDAPNPTRTTNKALRSAIEAVLDNRIPAVRETHGIGCSIRRAK